MCFAFPRHILFFSHIVFAQANVNEGLETAFLYVDAVKGSDSNSGTQSAAIQDDRQGRIGRRDQQSERHRNQVTINPGTYREAISLNHNKKDTSLPITFQAATNGTVIVSGSVLYTGWAKYQSNKSIYTNELAEQVGNMQAIEHPARFSRKS